MKAVIKCVNAIKANPKSERLFAAFCEGSDETHIRLMAVQGELSGAVHGAVRSSDCLLG
jgi:hypothetical protein